MILVTGGSGFIGSHIVKCLVSENRPVRVLIQNKPRAEQENRLKGLDIEWSEFVSDPRPFTPENIAPYMNTFRIKDTLSQFLGK